MPLVFREAHAAPLDELSAEDGDRSIGGQSVPLGAVANLRYEIEQPTIWRRARIPTITLKAGIVTSVQPKTIMDQLAPKVAELCSRERRASC